MARRGAVSLAGAGLLLGLAAGPAAGFASAAPPDHCVSTNGTTRVQTGTATCSSVAGPGNVARATGANSLAVAGTNPGDTHDRSTATGDNSIAFTGDGSNNTATASGSGSNASAGNGNGNTSTASGDGTFAQSGAGNNNTATASTPGCRALAIDGNGKTASC